MKYKALIFDLDGTAIPNKYEGMPSKRLIDNIEKASSKIHIAAASGRPLIMAHHILAALNLKNPCVLSGGTQVINFPAGDILWEKYITDTSSAHIFDLLNKYSLPTFYCTREMDDCSYSPGQPYPTDIRLFAASGMSHETALTIMDELKSIEGIAPHLVNSWNPGLHDVHITHEYATKKHALEFLLNKHGLQPEEVIAVGDSGNDMPLFKTAGLKIAMGNASQDLKNAADIIAPTVEDDGLAYVIERYILEL